MSVHDTIVAMIGKAMVDAAIRRPQETMMRVRKRCPGKLTRSLLDLAINNGIDMIDGLEPAPEAPR